MKEVLTIGFVATAISPYFSEEQQVRIKSENHLKKIIAEYDAKLICFHKTIFSKEDSVEAEKFFTGMFETSLKKGELVKEMNTSDVSTNELENIYIDYIQN
mgnify:CR=1 FL=1